MNTFDDFLTQYNNKPVEMTDPSNLNQCFDLVVAWCVRLGLPVGIFSGLLNAYEIWNPSTALAIQNFDYIVNTLTAIPQKGDIIVWSQHFNGGSGHTGIATGKGNENTFDCFEQNDPVGSWSHVKTYNYTNILGWLRFRTSASSSTVAVPTDIYPGLVHGSTQWDNVCQDQGLGDPKSTGYDKLRSVIAGYKSRATDLQNQLISAQAQTSNFSDQISRLKEQLIQEQNFHADLNTKLNQAIKNYSDMQTLYQGKVVGIQGQVDQCFSEKGALIEQIAQLKKSGVSFSWSELMVLLFKKIFGK